MASKRSYEDSESGETSEPVTKRSKGQANNTKVRHHQHSHIDPTWGQKYVFSNHDDATTVPVDSDLECEDDADAMAYLKSVRLEANGIPHLLVAPRIPIGPQLPPDFELPNGGEAEDDDAEEGENEEGKEPENLDRSIYQRGTGDFRGRYEDGAYIAGPDTWGEQGPNPRDGDDAEYDYDADWGDDPENLDHDSVETLQQAALHEAYFASLMNRYLALREALQSRPPEHAVAALPRTHSYHVGHFGPKSSVFAVWNHRLRNTDPLPAQVASMDRDAVMRVLRVLLSGKFLRRGCELRERTSRWLWALLARLPDRGEMGHVEVGWVRDLGRRAVLMARSLADMANLRDALEGEGMDLGVHEAVDDSEDDADALQEMQVEGADEEVEGNASSRAGEARKSAGNGGGSRGSDEFHAPRADREAAEAHEAGDATDGEAQQSEAMDCSEDGEVAEDDAGPTVDSLEAAKARVLARLDDVGDPTSGHDEGANAAVADAAAEAKSAEEQLRARMNMRATLNMILTVAGDFYGQRDLLEFREPFMGM